MTRKVKSDDHYNRRFDKTGYQRPPEGPPVFTTETPPDPTDADVPKNLVPHRDKTTGEPYLVEVQLKREAEASIALDGETLSVETSSVIPLEGEPTVKVWDNIKRDQAKEATVPTGSPRKKKKGFALKQGEQTETVVRLVREHVAIGERFNVNLVYGWFSGPEKDRWYRAYGDQIAVKNKLTKAITNVVFSGKHLKATVVINVSRTWVLESKSGTSTKGPRTKGVAPKKSLTPTEEIEANLSGKSTLNVLTGFKMIGNDLNGESLFINDAGVVGTLRFVPVE